MKRSVLVKIHMYLSAFFAPFLILMAISGTCYLMGNKGSIDKSIASKIIPPEANLNKEKVEELIKKIAPDYSYEYIKVKGSDFYTRPTTRTFYHIKKTQEGYTIFKAIPNFLASIIEVHKGHGPGFLKTLQKILGIALIFMLLSGFALAFQLKKDRLKTYSVSLVGLVTLIIMLIGL